MTLTVSVTRGELVSLQLATFYIRLFDLRSLYIRLGASMEKLLFCCLTERSCISVLQFLCFDEGTRRFFVFRTYVEHGSASTSDILSKQELSPVVQLLSNVDIYQKFRTRLSASTFNRVRWYNNVGPFLDLTGPGFPLCIAMF